MAAQPFYHRAVILFTAKNKEFTRDELTALLQKKLQTKDIVIGSPECEEVDAEPGDPQDL